MDELLVGSFPMIPLKRSNEKHQKFINETTDNQDRKEIPLNNTAENTTVPQRRIMTRSQTGTAIYPPNYLLGGDVE